MTTELKQSDAQVLSVEVFIGNLLRYGVLLSSAVTAVGIVMSLLATHGSTSALAPFIHEVMTGQLLAPVASPLGLLTSPTWSSLRDPNSVIALGLVLLIALPMVRVALTLVVFAVQRDRIYTLISAFVLLVLLLGLALGADF